MKRLPALVALGTALVLEVLGCGGSTSAFGHYSILLAGHNVDSARIFVWHPGSKPKPLTEALDYGPSGGGGFSSGITDGVWSPDGRSIAFEEDFPGGLAPPSPSIMVMRADGTHLKALTNDDPTEDGDSRPSWSPDGREIAYETSRIVDADGDTAQMLAIVDARSGHERFLSVRRLATLRRPVWGEAGIAFDSDSWSPSGVAAEVTHAEIVLAAGSGRVLGKLPLPGAARSVCDLAWSPDGKQILVSTSKFA